MTLLRALVRKDWTQHRTLRWFGIALSVATTPVMIAGAEATKRGWMPLAPASYGHDLESVFEASAIALSALWGVLSVLVCSHVLADDATGDGKSFLSNFPVRRRTVWFGNALSAALIVGACIASGYATWAMLAALLLGPTSIPTFGVRAAALAGLGLIVLGAWCSVAARPLVKRASVAALAGVGLAGFLAVASIVLGLAFPHAVVGEVSVSLWWPVIFGVPALAIASYRAVCTGEPSGHQRWRRWFVTVGFSFGLGATSFVAAAAGIAIRGDVSDGDGHPLSHRDDLRVTVFPHESTGVVTTVVTSLDGETLARFRGYQGPVWTADASAIVMVEEVSILGRRIAAELVVWDAEERRVRTRIPTRELGLTEMFLVNVTGDLAWLVAVRNENEVWHAVARLDGTTEAVEVGDLPLRDHPGDLLVVSRGGEDREFVRSDHERVALGTEELRRFSRTTLRLVDEAPFWTGHAITNPYSQYARPPRMGAGLSPSGRFFVVTDSDLSDGRDLVVLDIRDGRTSRSPIKDRGSRGGAWARGDRYYWTDEEGDLWRWSESDAAGIRVRGLRLGAISPDERRFIAHRGATPRFLDHVTVFDATSETCATAPSPIDRAAVTIWASHGNTLVQWAGPNTLAWQWVGGDWAYTRTDALHYGPCDDPSLAIEEHANDARAPGDPAAVRAED